MKNIGFKLATFIIGALMALAFVSCKKEDRYHAVKFQAIGTDCHCYVLNDEANFNQVYMLEKGTFVRVTANGYTGNEATTIVEVDGAALDTHYGTGFLTYTYRIK